MFDLQEYVRKLLIIKEDRLLGNTELAREMGMHFTTLTRMLKGEVVSLQTMRKIKKFVERHENNGQLQ